ncbi:MAG: HD domain-containing protein [Magnetospiraceae bacterium]
MNEKTETPRLSDRFDAALSYAAALHRTQLRKGTEIPYVSHLLAVTATVLEHGGTETEAIAALLHDAAEDQGGLAQLDHIRATFGDTVADIVAECSDTFETPKPPWRERKEKDLAKVGQKSAAARLVSAADKLHNARAMLRDCEALGEDLWSRFKGGKEGTIWYLNAYGLALCGYGPADLGNELLSVVRDLKKCAGLLRPAMPAGATDYSNEFFQRRYFCACGHEWEKRKEFTWWDTEPAPAAAEMDAAQKVGDTCPHCGAPVPPKACPDCGGKVRVERENLVRSALEDYAYENEDYVAVCGNGHRHQFARRFDGKK